MVRCGSDGSLSVWERSSRASKIDVDGAVQALLLSNRACRTITDSLKATPLSALCKLSGICPLSICREVQARSERYKQLNDPRLPLHGHQEVPRRLRSRHSFMTVQGLGAALPNNFKMEKWNENDSNNNEALPPLARRFPRE